MEITDPLDFYDQLDRSDTDEAVVHNLNVLREANAKIAQKKSFYQTRERRSRPNFVLTPLNRKI
jgi:hypothetical protein